VDILAKDTAESKVETAMEVTLNLLKDSRRPPPSPVVQT